MLTLREKLIVLFATAPDGFSITPHEVAAKYKVGLDHVYPTLRKLRDRDLVEKESMHLFRAGVALREEVGAA